MKTIPQKFSFEENWENVVKFKNLLRQRGLEIPLGSPLEKASLVNHAIWKLSKNELVHDCKIDCREDWRFALSLADLVRKILRASSRSNFEALLPHIKLLLEPANLSQYSACFSAHPKEKETNNKIFELFVAVVLFQVCSNLRFDDPIISSRTKRPDVIGEFRKKTWGFECKTMHSPNPKTFLERVRDAIEQIQAAQEVERGIVIVNFKNLFPHDSMWPARYNPQTEKWEYLSLLVRDHPKIEIEHMVENFEKKVFDTIGGYQNFIKEFDGKKTLPTVFVFSCTVANFASSPQVRGPIVIKKMSGIGTPFKQLDSEAVELLDLFNDYLYDRTE